MKDCFFVRKSWETASVLKIAQMQSLFFTKMHQFKFFSFEDYNLFCYDRMIYPFNRLYHLDQKIFDV